MTIRVVFFSDTHLGFDLPVRRRAHDSRSGPRRPIRGPDFFSNFHYVLDYARRTRADALIHGGDLFFRSKVHPSIVDRAYQGLLDVAEHGIPVLIVPGNHERSVLPESLFLGHRNIHVFDRPRSFDLSIRNERLCVHGFPFLRNVRAGFASALASCGAVHADPDAISLLCCHHAIDGAAVGPNGYVFRNADDVIDVHALPPGFAAILAGHIHRHQVLQAGSPIIYCGSTERTSFAEKDETKGFCEMLLDTDGLANVAFHHLPTRPMLDLDALGCRNEDDVCRAFDALDSPDTAIVRVHLDTYPSRMLSKRLARSHSGIVQFAVAFARSQRNRTPAHYPPNKEFSTKKSAQQRNA